VRKLKWIWITAWGAVLLGLPYVLRAFGPTEAEVVRWGEISIGVGIALGVAWLISRIVPYGFLRWLLTLGSAAVALLQPLPAWLWLVFHGTGISDGTPPASFVAHWTYALPHLALFIIGSLGALTASGIRSAGGDEVSMQEQKRRSGA
jgi:hypothetical protein